MYNHINPIPKSANSTGKANSRHCNHFLFLQSGKFSYINCQKCYEEMKNNNFYLVNFSRTTYQEQKVSAKPKKQATTLNIFSKAAILNLFFHVLPLFVK